MPDNSTAQVKPLLLIKPRKSWQIIDFQELFHYRDLFYFLIMRDINVRYKQSVLGGLWAIIQPFFAMVVFTIFFGKLAKMPSDGIPYPIFSYTAMIAWTYFSNAVTNAGNCLITSSNLISKVYFPRLIIPISAVLSGLVDFFMAFLVLFFMMFYFQVFPGPWILILPVLIIMMILSSSGVGMFLAALNAKYRDIRYTIPFLIQVWLFASPIAYPTSIIPEQWRLFYAINPMVGVIEGFRVALLGRGVFPVEVVLISGISSLILFGIGIYYFKQTERFFADII